MLSQPERRQLSEIERWLEQSDPHLTRTMRAGMSRRRLLDRPLTRILLSVACALTVLWGFLAMNFPTIFFGILGSLAIACLYVADQGSGDGG